VSQLVITEKRESSVAPETALNREPPLRRLVIVLMIQLACSPIDRLPIFPIGCLLFACGR
jgi:hypothetical protein